MLEKQTITIADDKTIWDDLGVTTLLWKMRQRKWLVLVIPVAWVIFSNIGFYLSGIAYTAEMLVIPASLSGEAKQGSNLGNLLGGIGLDLGDAGSGADKNFPVYLETWKSSWFAQQLLKNPDLTHRIFAGEWSEREKKWIRPSGIGTIVKPLIKELFGGTPTAWSPPDTEALLGFLAGHVIEDRARTDVTTKISISLKDRQLAEDILRFGHASINSHLAELYRKRADENVGYILGELDKVSVSDYRQVLLNNLTQVESTRMLAFSNPEFAAMSTALYVTSSPTKPDTIRIVLIGLLLAVFLYLVLVMLGDRLRLPLMHGETLSEIWTLFGLKFNGK